MVSNVVIGSGARQSDSLVHTPVSVLFQTPFPFRFLRNIEHSSLCYTVGLRWLKVLSVSCLVVSDSVTSMDHNLPGSSVHGILQARLQEWIAIPFSKGSS